MHIRSHEIRNGYRCVDCVRLHTNLKSFKRHRRRDHPSPLDLKISKRHYPRRHQPGALDGVTQERTEIGSSNDVEMFNEEYNTNGDNFENNGDYSVLEEEKKSYFESAEKSDDDMTEFEKINFEKQFRNDPENNTPCFENLLLNDAKKCVAFLYALPDLPRKRVEKFIEIITEFMRGAAFSELEKNVLRMLKNLNTDHQEEILNIKNLFKLFKEPFKRIDSEHKAFEEF